MKPSFSYRPPHARRSGRRSLITVTFFVILVVLADWALGGAIRVQVRSLSATVTQWGLAIGDSIVNTGFFSSRRAEARKNQILTEKVAQCEERAVGYDVLKTENDELRAMLRVVGSVSGEGQGGITAPIASSIRSSPYGTFLVGAGAADGIAKGALVLTGGGFVVGTITDVGTHISTVTEIFAPGATIDAAINSATVPVFGYGGGNARMKLPRSLFVETDDIVFAPGFEQRAIGVVGAIASSSANASQDVYVHLPVNLGSLRYVYILLSE
ncbi:MAG: rod shape-determining protein MreC [Patescibacteria group bacterium]